jgi:hypothetical protein
MYGLKGGGMVGLVNWWLTLRGDQIKKNNTCGTCRVQEMRNPCRIVVEKTEGKRGAGRYMF